MARKPSPALRCVGLGPFVAEFNPAERKEETAAMRAGQPVHDRSRIWHIPASTFVLLPVPKWSYSLRCR